MRSVDRPKVSETVENYEIKHYEYFVHCTLSILKLTAVSSYGICATWQVYEVVHLQSLILQYFEEPTCVWCLLIRAAFLYL